MAARWRGEDGNLNTGNCSFLASNSHNEVLTIPRNLQEFVLSRLDVDGMEMDTQSCVDHSILAIFEDSAAVPEDKSGAEEEGETLLSALTEMLDSVEDDNGTLSPFDTLPDTQLLAQREHRDYSVDRPLADRLRPRSKSANVTFTIKIDGEKGDESQTTERNSPSQLFKQQSQTLFHAKSRKAEAEVDVFTATSLVNLVKIMHPYCLKLHVEDEGDTWRRNHTLFSQEEVWKYERPSEESDEEINVVSDDEVTVKETKEADEGENGKLLKSVLLNANCRAPPSRGKKRVSFGPVQVASFDISVETASALLNKTKALENPAGSALEVQTPSSEANSKADVLPPKGETKTKSLSLQQYRQLRQKRQPLVEKQGNNTTKWPSVSEPPKELTPILCLQRQSPQTVHCYADGRRSGADHLHRSPGSRTHRASAPPRPHPSEATPSSHLLRSGSKCPRTQTEIISRAGPLPAVTTNTNVIQPKSKKSPVKKSTVLSSDPPNPVLLPFSQTLPPSTDHASSEAKVEFLNRDPNPDSTRHFEQIQNESSGTSPHRRPPSTEPKPEEVSMKQDCTALFQAIQTELTEIASGVTSRPPALCPSAAHIEPSPEVTQPQPRKSSLSPTKETKPEPKTAPSPSQPPAPAALKETVAEAPPGESPPPALQFGCGVQSATAGSGIEAPDLTSLLEQFEETQAKEERVEPKRVSSNLQSDERRTQKPVRTPSTGTRQPSSTSESVVTVKSLRNPPDLGMSEGVAIPEPLCTEIIVSTQRDLPARRKNPPSKAIQIIDPRPLPSKKTTHSNQSEFPAAHIFSSVSSDHDYCGPVDRSLPHAAQRSRASKLKDTSRTSDELPVLSHDSSAAAESSCAVSATIRAVDNSNTNNEKPVMQHLSEEPRTRPETDKVLSLSDSAATEQDHGCAAEDKAAKCTLPTPPPSPPDRGREKGRYRRRSPLSDSSCSSRSSSSSSSSSSSASRSPKRKKCRHRRSERNSCSSSPSRSISRSPPRRYRWSYSGSRRSRSRSRSWSHSRSPSRSRSPSPQICRGQWRDVYSRETRKFRREHEIRIQKLKAIDERRVVYVGRICRSMTHDELRQRFSQFGEVECVSLHFRDRGDHYGFVTFYNMEDAFAAIDNSGKLRRPDELPFDICFGGRRQFCNSDYADLDANRDADPPPAKSGFKDLDFDSLLKQAQRGLKR